MYVSTVNETELLRLASMEDVMYFVGVHDGDTYVDHPPCCSKCGGFVYVEVSNDKVSSWGQCFDCNEMLPVYYSDSLNLRKPWSRA